jgi:predicted exporter
MEGLQPVGRLYEWFATRRPILYLVTAGLLLASLLCLPTIDLEEDISAMLPEGQNGVASDFTLLQQAPFIHNLVITLSRQGSATREDLTKASDQLAAGLKGPLFGRVVNGPPLEDAQQFFTGLLQAMPGLTSVADLAAIATHLTPEGIRERVQACYRDLLSLQGPMVKPWVQLDPLNLRFAQLQKLQGINMIPKARLSGNRFISQDGLHALMIAESPVPITDSQRGRQVIDQIARAADRLPVGITLSLVSGHRYAIANAETLKRDVTVILTAASFAIAALYLFFMRRWQALLVFLVPLAVVAPAIVAVAMVFGKVSAITIGFGAVLMGIAEDYAVHLYFALGKGEGPPAAILSRVTKPVIFGLLTTLGAFAILMFSALPGQRQLAVFSIAGLCLALVLSLVVLPHLLATPAMVPKAGHPLRPAFPFYPRRGWVLSAWVLILVSCAGLAKNVHFNGDLRSLQLVPPEIKSAEAQLQDVWGDMRARAILFVEANDLETALQINEQVHQELSERMALSDTVSLATLLPSQKTQAENQKRWKQFWQSGPGKAILQGFDQERRTLGFSDQAFDPFYRFLAAEPRMITPASLRHAGMGDLVNALLLQGDKGPRILTLVPDNPETIAFLKELTERVAGARLVSGWLVGQKLSKALIREQLQFIALALMAIVLLLAWLFRRTHKVLCAMIPVVTGLCVMLGLMGLLGIDFNLFNGAAAILVIGLSVDYGIFMVCRQEKELGGETEQAVLVSGLTTLFGFGVLILARHPALYSIGLTVLLGIGAAIPAALLVIPAVYPGKRP